MNHLKPCPFCGSQVRMISYWQSFDDPYAEFELEIGCYKCGDFTLTHKTYYDGPQPRTAYDIWNTRVHEIYSYSISGEDDADDWSED